MYGCKISGKAPITVVVPVRNEEKNLGTCLAALKRFAHVIVVDSSSTDATVAIARSHGAEVLNFIWNGAFPKKRNWVLMNQAFATDWVLFLDADEIVSDSFIDSAIAHVASGGHVGYWLNYTNHFMGQALHHGLPQRKLALFRVGAGLYERIEEDAWSKLDMEVHEHPVLTGSVGEISERIDHRCDQGLVKFLDRHVQYAAWEARRTLALDRAAKTDPSLTQRQRFKYANIQSWWFPGFYFLYAAIVRGGVLDGRAGLRYAFYKSWYFRTVRLMVKELRAGQGS